MSVLHGACARERGYTMERRKFLLGVGGASLGTGALVGSGAFSAMRAERTVSIDVVEDPGALVGLDSCPGSDNAMYSGVNENGQLYIDISEEPNEGDGVNGDSRYWFHDTFQVCNQSDHSICLWVVEHEGWPETSDGNPRVDFYLGDNPDESILGAANAHELGSGECTCVGIYTNTLGLTSADVDTLLENLDDEISIRANAECPDVEDEPGQSGPECQPCQVSESDGTEDFLTIENLDAGNFPEITATARVETDDGGDGDLTANDFEVCETFGGDNFGQDSTVAFAGEDESAEADVMIVLDTSSSMTFESGKFQNAKDGAKTLVDTLGPGVNVGLVEFESSATLVTGLTSDHGSVKTAIGTLTAVGGTDVGSGIDRAQTELDNNGRDVPRYMVVLGNGDTSGGEIPANNAKNEGTTIYGIAYGTGASLSAFEYIVGEVPTGRDPQDSVPDLDEDRSDPDWEDYAYDAGTDDIASIFEDIGEIISGTYSITYTTCNPDTDGSMRDVLVHVDDPEGVSTATESYTAPSS
ncbi:VWA domain-containing protein [Natronomonas halophila]|uniref:VWA domain-containing protein n=1 Tax=Natronomonas halophila TaxID=2747817 RepID=UPI0015B659EE|nr:VWA domain-containing protein [Natronomonas halophila]QLD86567.1 VWA domain-containing protein [Natronomonas halophila]